MSEEKICDADSIFNGLWNDKDYANAKLNATKAAAAHAPLLTRLATAVDIRCGGSTPYSIKPHYRSEPPIK